MIQDSNHTPVLLNEVVEILNPKPKDFFIDGTLNGGGHEMEIIKHLEPNGIFLGIDWDKDMIEGFRLQVSGSRFKSKIILVNNNFKNLSMIIKEKELSKADGLLLDLGFSLRHLENSGRGFSFQKNEPLDMRYSSEGVTAAEVINSFREKELADLLWQYGEERFSRRIAKEIVQNRKQKLISTTTNLVEIIKQAVPVIYLRQRIHFATRTFLALRIFVNQELENLTHLLKNILDIVDSGGRVAIISFNSLEDRIVKNYFQELTRQNQSKLLVKKLICPSHEEEIINPRSRSAKLRAIQIV